jgi:hypothetical protein
MLRPEGFTPYVSSGQPETTFDVNAEAEPIDYSDGIPVQDPATIAATEALTALTESAISAAPDTSGLTLITRGPHAGKYIDSSGRLVMP